MAANKRLLALPGDGIGPEVMRQVYRLVQWFDRKRIATFEVREASGEHQKNFRELAERD